MRTVLLIVFVCAMVPLIIWPGLVIAACSAIVRRFSGS